MVEFAPVLSVCSSSWSLWGPWSCLFDIAVAVDWSLPLFKVFLPLFGARLRLFGCVCVGFFSVYSFI